LEIVAGIGLKGIKPQVWDSSSPYYLHNLKAVMISYADFHQMPKRRCQAMENGLHNSLNIPKEVKIYLDNGAFYFLSHGGETPIKEYEEFVAKAKPDWCPIPQDFIPTPKMTLEEQKNCFTRTMQMNLDYQVGPYIPVIHISNLLEDYINQIKAHKILSSKSGIALGGIVPNLLRASKAIPHKKILAGMKYVCEEFKDRELHIFGIGGTATLHLAALLGTKSVDSSGWRNRAARGIIQLPGTGDRIIAELGNWKGRKISLEEVKRLKTCQCPACQKYSLEGLKINGVEGFCNRATHNLHILLEETRLIEEHLTLGTYREWCEEHLDNSTYRPLINQILELSDFH
jgi:7-cyano-7-deazaguanine tRNA-ribosyltransferase